MFDWFEDHPALMILAIGLGLMTSYYVSELMWPAPKHSGCPDGQRLYADMVEQTSADGGLTLKLNMICRERE